MIISVLLIGFACSNVAKLAPEYLDELELYKLEHHKGLVEGERAPLKPNQLDKVKYFAPTKQSIVRAKFTRTADSEPFQMTTYSGKTKPFRKYGVIRFEYKGQPSELSIYQSLQGIRMPQYKNHLFLPFKDETNGERSYGGGRYIDLVQSDIKKNELILDFNKAYNPWCAYSDGYNCPIPPHENHLPYPLKSGEMAYEK